MASRPPPPPPSSTSQSTNNAPPPSRQPLTDSPKPSSLASNRRPPRQHQPIDLSTIEIVDLTDPSSSSSSRPPRRPLDSPTSDRPSKRSKGKDPETLSLDQDESTPPPPRPQLGRTTTPQSGSLSLAKCVICLDSPTDLTATPCGHLFCDFCIRSALKTGQGGRGRGVAATYTGTCPICRRRITTRSLIPLEIKVRTLG